MTGTSMPTPTCPACGDDKHIDASQPMMRWQHLSGATSEGFELKPVLTNEFTEMFGTPTYRCWGCGFRAETWQQFFSETGKVTPGAVGDDPGVHV